MDTSPSALHVKTDGSVAFNYNAFEEGSHEFAVSYNESPLEGTPIRLNVAKTEDGKVLTIFGSGLRFALCGKPTEFFIQTSLNKNDVQVNMDGPSPVDIKRKQHGHDVITVEYIAFCPGEYRIDVLYKGQSVHGSPFTAKVAGEGKKRRQLSIMEPSDLNLGIKMTQLDLMSAVISGPDGTPEPCLLKILKDDYLGITSFEPKVKGTYTIHIEDNSIPHPKSPIKVHITDREIGNASLVRVQGRLKQGKAGVWNDIRVDCSGAGYGELYISIEGSHNTDFRYKSDGKLHTVEYKPHEPGAYQMFIMFADEPISGAPFLLEIGGEPSGRKRTVVSKQVQYCDIVAPHSNSNFVMSLPGVNPLDLEASITCPTGLTDLCEIKDKPGNFYEISFIPKEAGLNVVNITEKGLHVKGSPVHFTVGKPPPGGVHKIEVSGVGIERGIARTKNFFNIYEREAGPGVLSVAMSGPSKPELSMHDNGTGFVSVSYEVDEPGTYSVGVKYDGFHVEGSPFKVTMEEECKEAKLIAVQGIRDRGAEVERPITFQVCMNGSKGSLKVNAVTPTAVREEIQIQDAENDSYSCRFIPKENGVFHVNVTFNGTHVTGSPFAILVGKLGAQPALVKTRGRGLEKGEVGKQCRFDVVTVNCGQGPLHVTITGPIRFPINCIELTDGYEYSYLARCPGEYLISIKFCSVHIPGSPFLVNMIGYSKMRSKNEAKEISQIVINAVEKKHEVNKSGCFIGDASKIFVSGLGLKKGFMGRSSNFIVDVTEAGQGLLVVSMVSSNGTPPKELLVKKQKPGIYQASFVPEERGDHVMNVRWGKEDVSGSPFYVLVS